MAEKFQIPDRPDEDKRVKTPSKVPGEELFTVEEVQAIETQALADVEKDRKAKAKVKLLERKKREALALFDSAEELVEYTIFLPTFGGKKGGIYSCITIDGIRYYHNQTKEFSRRQYETIRDIVQNAWRHEEVAFGQRDPNASFQPRNPSVNAANGSGQFMRV